MDLHGRARNFTAKSKPTPHPKAGRTLLSFSIDLPGCSMAMHRTSAPLIPARDPDTPPVVRCLFDAGDDAGHWRWARFTIWPDGGHYGLRKWQASVGDCCDWPMSCDLFKRVGTWRRQLPRAMY